MFVFQSCGRHSLLWVDGDAREIDIEPLRASSHLPLSVSVNDTPTSTSPPPQMGRIPIFSDDRQR